MSVTLHFHPDWPFADGLVIEAMARDGSYRSQFETGTSNGVLTRTTFCFPDSVFEPEAIGGPDRLDELVVLCEAAGHDLLDDYIEAHVHGGVRFDADVKALVLDPCHADGPVARVWHLLARFGVF